ncbi:hypothetical protein GTZ99_03580 [Novosphingobium sp. FSY-8]|uniref:Bacterial virulence protein VirB8 domain-containing protein n=1 Tax=Novosphingobium ovatum TaxID=1908523 RepID=A0ABW9XAS0_9SPHN|nr:VirB8/TrbF family protein [Novosphingobium ovatum]NBC35633.1 hypothetical protein [Novosphingobium ovatum]
MSGAEAAISRESYYPMAQGWADNAEVARRRHTRLAWTIAALACGVAGLEAMALIALTPLKTTVPYTLLVDRSTGHVQALQGDRAPQIGIDAALTQSLLAQYVVAREGFDPLALNDRYQQVARWSEGAVRADYLAAMARDNPQSPLNAYPRGTLVAVQVASISPLSANTALVRFARERRDPTGAVARDHWVAVVGWRYSGAPMAMEARLANPLGFAVTSYRRDPEAVPMTPVAASSPAPVVAAPVVAPGPAAPAALMPPPERPAEPARGVVGRMRGHVR